jgi:hypothetical protein
MSRCELFFPNESCVRAEEKAGQDAVKSENEKFTNSRQSHRYMVPVASMSQQAASSSSSIVLRAPDGEVGWILVELQGTVAMRNGSAIDGMELARLVRDVRLPRSLFALALASVPLPCFALADPVRALAAHRSQADGSAPKLIIGKVSIEGEEFKLKKPLAVMALNKAADGTREYRALGVVRHKVIFRRHPLPIHNGGRAAAAAPMTEANKRQRLSVNGQEAVTPSPLPAAIA